MIHQLKTHLKTLCVAALLAATAIVSTGCSKDGSADIAIDIVPAHPVAINADFSLYDAANSTPGTPVYITIKAPWIKFSYTLENENQVSDSDKTVTIVAINLIYTGYDQTGAALSGTGSFTVSGVAGAPTTIVYPFLAEVAPGGVLKAGTDLANSTGTFDPLDGYAGTFYASGLPLSSSTTTTTAPTTFVPTYTVQATFVGWFGTYDNPKKRFQKTITFATQ